MSFLPRSPRSCEWIVSHENILPSSIIYGHSFVSTATKEGIDYLLNNYSTQLNDVYITSFPRSGTHWIMKICLEIMRNCSFKVLLTRHSRSKSSVTKSGSSCWA